MSVGVAAACSVLATAACGGDPYSGTWKLITTDGGHATISIEKSDAGWIITDSRGERTSAVERDGKLVVTGPKGVGWAYARVGGVLQAWYKGDRDGDFRKQ